MSRVYQATWKVKGPDGQVIVKKAKNWTCEWTDASGISRHKIGGTTERQAMDTLRRLEARVIDEKNGNVVVKMSDIRCADLVTGYLMHLHQQVSPAHYQNVKHQIEIVLKAAKAHHLGDLSPIALDKFKTVTADAEVAPRTINTYLQAIKAMLNWAVARRMIPYNPLTCVAKLPEAAVRPRRPLELHEIPLVLKATLEGPVRRAMRRGSRPRKDGKPNRPSKLSLRAQAKCAADARRNYLIYAVLMGTGLRVNELRNLKWRDIDFDTVVLRLCGDWTKNGKSDVLPIAPQLVDLLQEWKASRDYAPDAPVVAVTSRALAIFNDDIEAAGIEKVDAQGRVLCLHSLRHTFGQLLNAAGTDPKTLQTLMRHSSPTMSLGVYVHRDKNRERDAVAELAALVPGKSNLGEGHDNAPAAQSSSLTRS